jgi:hypothetical protein
MSFHGMEIIAGKNREADFSNPSAAYLALRCAKAEKSRIFRVEIGMNRGDGQIFQFGLHVESG